MDGARKRWLGPLLAFISGYVDTAVFILMGGLFVAHVTGNFVLLGTTLAGASVSGHSGSTSLQLIAFPVFFVAAMLAATLAGRVAPERRTGTLLWLVAVIVVGAGAAGLAQARLDAALSLALVVAMGLLNAAHRLDPKIGAPFTVMTGNVTGLAVALARGLRLAPRDETGPPAAAGAAIWLVVMFAVGCALGAVAQAYLRFAAMLVPGGLLLLWLLVARLGSR